MVLFTLMGDSYTWSKHDIGRSIGFYGPFFEHWNNSRLGQ